MILNKQALISPKKVEQPFSWVGHIPFASWVINELKPSTFVELGTHSGNSYFSFCQSIQENGLNTKAYAVDTWQGDEHAGSYGEEIWNDVDAYNEEHYKPFSTLIRKTFDDALEAFDDGSIDLLHIDGLHSYEAVKYDFETWLPKVSSQGVILFHDTVVKERGFGVYKLWDELSQQYPGFNFEHSYGLGVLLVGEKCKFSLNTIGVDNNKISECKDLFERLGNKVFEFECRASLAEELRGHLEAEKKNAVEQIEYRDALVEDLRGQVEVRDEMLSSRKHLLKLLFKPKGK